MPFETQGKPALPTLGPRIVAGADQSVGAAFQKAAGLGGLGPALQPREVARNQGYLKSRRTFTV
jgi:hypothetical protein